MTTPPTTAPATPDRLLRDHEAAEILAVSRRHIHALAARGELPRVRLGRASRYRLADVLALIARGAA